MTNAGVRTMIGVPDPATAHSAGIDRHALVSHLHARRILDAPVARFDVSLSSVDPPPLLKGYFTSHVCCFIYMALP